MISFFQNSFGSILLYKYASLFLVTFLSCVGFPLPAAPSTIAAAVFANQGFLNLYLVFLTAFAGNVAGDLTLYWLTRKFGRQVLLKLGLKKMADSVALQHVEHTVVTYKAAIVLTSRFQVQATGLINALAGLGKMDAKKFTTYVLIGETLQLCFYITLGYVFSGAWQLITDAIGQFGWIVALVMAICITYFSSKIIHKGMNHPKIKRHLQ